MNLLLTCTNPFQIVYIGVIIAKDLYVIGLRKATLIFQLTLLFPSSYHCTIRHTDTKVISQ